MEETAWEVALAKPAWKTYEAADPALRERLDRCFASLQSNPRSGNNIKPLTGKLKGLFRYRVGEWRVIYRLMHDQGRVEVVAILPRGDAY